MLAHPAVIVVIVSSTTDEARVPSGLCYSLDGARSVALQLYDFRHDAAHGGMA